MYKMFMFNLKLEMIDSTDSYFSDLVSVGQRPDVPLFANHAGDRDARDDLQELGRHREAPR